MARGGRETLPLVQTTLVRVSVSHQGAPRCSLMGGTLHLSGTETPRCSAPPTPMQGSPAATQRRPTARACMEAAWKLHRSLLCIRLFILTEVPAPRATPFPNMGTSASAATTPLGSPPTPNAPLWHLTSPSWLDTHVWTIVHHSVAPHIHIRLPPCRTGGVDPRLQSTIHIPGLSAHSMMA
jgi:hypothetical protein